MTPRIRTLLAAAFVLPLLGGCFGADDPLPPGDPASPVPAPQAVPAEEQVAPAAETEEEPPPRLEIARRLEQSISVGIPCPTRPGATDCAAGRMRSQRLDVPYGGPAKAVLTATWDAQTEVSRAFRISFSLNAEGAPEHAAISESPLVLEIPPDSISVAGEYRVVVRPTTPGATFNEVVDYVLVLDYR